VWNWQWSCGADSSDSCTACNTTVAIRILSPGDDGDLVQSISSTSTSVAQTISSTLQQSIQQIVASVPAQPSAIQLPSPLSAIDSTPWPSLELTVPALPELPAWPTISSGSAAEPATSFPLLLLLDTEPISLDDAGGGAVIELPTFGVRPHDGSLDAMLGSRRSFGVAGSMYTAAGDRATLQERAGQVLAPPRHREAAAAGGASQSPSKPRLPLRVPQRMPFGFGPDLSPGASASGSSSSLGGFALLLGVLLLVVPSALQLIWVGAAIRPRRYTPGRPEHPG